MEQIRLLKFITGELILALVRDSENDGALWLQNPIMVVSMQTFTGEVFNENYLLKPWIGVTVDTNFMVRKSDIIVSCNPHVNLLEQYNHYLNGSVDKQSPPDIDLELETYRAESLRSKKLLN